MRENVPNQSFRPELYLFRSDFLFDLIWGFFCFESFYLQENLQLINHSLEIFTVVSNRKVESLCFNFKRNHFQKDTIRTSKRRDELLKIIF